MDVAMCLSTANPPSISRQTKIHNIGATLVGVDKFGNKYYEKLQDTQHGEQYSIVLVDLLQLLLMWNSSVVPLEFRS
jgi:NADH dehydrogenase (ubiquinone) 1 alpha subcomplex subunit 12